MDSQPVGYCAVISPKLDFYQSYFIYDDEVSREGASQIKLMGIMAAPVANPYGALQAALAEGALTNNNGVIMAASRALYSTDAPYFYIIADKQSHGTATSLHKIDASSIEDARAKIEGLPEVQDIKRRLMGKISTRDGQGRRMGFH